MRVVDGGAGPLEDGLSQAKTGMTANRLQQAVAVALLSVLGGIRRPRCHCQSDCDANDAKLHFFFPLDFWEIAGWVAYHPGL
jgi:hypothetical protein